MKRVVGVAFATVAMVCSAYADDCKAISADLDRLACYDKESGRTPKKEPIQTIARSKWDARKETSAMTDKTNVFLSLESNEVINCGWNRGAKIALLLRCTDGTTAAIFQTGCHMASSEYRVDAEKARTVSGTESTNNRTLGLWSGGQSIPFIKQLIGKSKLTARMTPYGENPFTATFDIAGLEEAIKPLRKECQW